MAIYWIPVMPKAIQRGELLLSLRRGAGTPVRLQLERALRAAIQAGRLQPGSPLPSTRVLASDLVLSRALVVEAYEQLRAEGYVYSQPGSATIVAARPAHRAPASSEFDVASVPRFDFRPGRPDPSLFPRRAWLSALRRVLATAPAADLDYPDPRGGASARIALASYLNRSRATAAHPDRILLCTGFAQGMRLLCETLRAGGVRRIAVEDPGHAFESADVRASGVEITGVPVDDRGICVERLTKFEAGAVLVTPAHQYPTGVVLAPERRIALLAWADRTGGFVVEDDYDGEYRYDREPLGALQGLAPERVIYIGSASKILAPALRVGWVLAPESLIGSLSRFKLEADRGSAALDQLALAEFIDSGDLDRHLRRTRLIYRHRRELLAATLRTCLPDQRVQGVAAGLHLILELPEEMDEAAVVAEAGRRSVGIYGVRAYRSDPGSGPSALLLGFCRISEADLAEGVKRLAEVLRSMQAPPRACARKDTRRQT
jgi:GntR family transcriptional regulator/MocR family aminotransferase